MAQNESEIRYLTPPTVEVKKKKYCRFKKNRIKYIDYKDPEFLKWAKGASVETKPISGDETHKIILRLFGLIEQYKGDIEKYFK